MVAPFTGAWIEISNLRNISSGCWKSHPSRVRGLKLCQRNDVFDNRGVAPFTGAWIEMLPNGSSTRIFDRSHPSRVRGLKFGAFDYWPLPMGSHPSRVRGLKSVYG